jgi:hypothetical protein
MNTQAKVAIEKENHPERFCKAVRCLWRVLSHDMVSKPNCANGVCPRHAGRI